MGTNLFILAGLLVVIVLLGIIGILSRYRKCKSDEVLVVYGKTGGSKSAISGWMRRRSYWPPAPVMPSRVCPRPRAV